MKEHQVLKRCKIALLSFLLFVVGCSQKSNDAGPRYGASPDDGNLPVHTFAFYPLYNPEKLMQAYYPLVDYLNTHIQGGRFTLEASRDYAAFEEKYKEQAPAFILSNPWQTLQAIKCHYQVIAMAGEPADFRGIFLVRRESKIKLPADLKGKTVSYPAPTSLAGCIMPQFFLYRHGIDVNRDIENKYVGSQESSIMSVYYGNSAAGATWPGPWRIFQKDHTKEARALKIIWETESLVNMSVMVRNDIPDDIKQQVRKLLLELHHSEQGKTILDGMETSRFREASDKDYEGVRSYIEQFEKKVRKIDIQ